MASQAENAQAFSNLFAENISVRNLKLPLRTLPGSLQLQVPSLPSEITARIVPYDTGNANDIPRLIKLLRLLQPWESGCYQSLLTQADAMLKSVTEMFPLELPSDIRLCQAGWLAVFLMVDDLLESIPSSESQDCILEAVEMVNEFPRETSMSISSGNATPCKIHHSLRVIYTWFEGILNPHLLNMVTREIISVLIGFAMEAHYREKKVYSLGSYMAVRTKTIGIGPFMTMAIWGILGRRIEHKELNALMDKIKHVVGLQNDLIGLEKDIRSGECMNSVLILARSGQVGDVVNEQQTILARAQRVYEMHNQ